MKSFIRQKLESLIKCEIIPTWRVDRLAQSRYLSRLIERHAIDCIFDVGANEGQYRDYLRDEVGFDGLIISFEPNPECVKKLRARAEHDNKWVVFGHALGASIGTLEFNIMKSSQFSSFLIPDNARFFGAHNVISESIPVEVRTVNEIYGSLISEFQFSRPFLKLDTQGFDLEVVKGARDVISHFIAIQSEVSNVSIYQGISSMSDTLKFFDAEGFELGLLFPANPDQFPIAVDFDAYFIPRGRP